MLIAFCLVPAAFPLILKPSKIILLPRIRNNVSFVVVSNPLVLSLFPKICVPSITEMRLHLYIFINRTGSPLLIAC